MITSNELKRLLESVPDYTPIMIDGNPNVDIIGVQIDLGTDAWVANLQITEGFSVTKDSIIKSMFECLKP